MNQKDKEKDDKKKQIAKAMKEKQKIVLDKKTIRK